MRGFEVMGREVVVGRKRVMFWIFEFEVPPLSNISTENKEKMVLSVFQLRFRKRLIAEYASKRWEHFCGAFPHQQLVVLVDNAY